ncbi:MAG TPA: mannose-1-phosphate guanylyltransferase [Candidatus Eisenbacteria bacterium]|jgi:mannose-1-phosphate guanylyltransferase
MPDRYVLVLAGGRGERFWPWSRPDRPKQLLPLAGGGRSLLAATLSRAVKVVPPECILVLTAKDLVAAATAECPPGARVMGEPAARNTAPAIGLAAGWFLAQSPDACFAVLPADHAVDDEAAFARDLERAFALAEQGPVLVTFGIAPSGPDTNFGYIRRSTRLSERVYRAAAFTEKPDRAAAARYLESGEYLWNSGIFVWRARVFLDALEASRPALASTLRSLAENAGTPAWERRVAEVFPDCEAISVDYAVMEHAPNVLVIEASFDWDDLGSWSAWARRQPRDSRGNVVFGRAVALDCDRCVVVGDGGTVAALGLADMVVVHVDGATLACRLDQSEGVRRVSDAVRTRDSAAWR